MHAHLFRIARRLGCFALILAVDLLGYKKA